MQGPNYIEAKDILNATNGGLDIILNLYPQAVGSEINRNRKFKIHEEKTASANLYKADDGNWLVTDFGDDSKPRNGILCYMVERGVDYVTALRELAALYGITEAEQVMNLVRATYSERPAEADDIENKWTWEVRDHLTDFEIETIVSKNVLKTLGYKPMAGRSFASSISEHGELVSESAAKKKHDDAYVKIKTTFTKYHWHSLISYSLVKNRKVMTFSATEDYPIFLIDENSHQKIYQPKHPDKSKRFMYAGTKPKDFIHGYTQLKAEFERRKKKEEEEANKLAEDDDRGIDIVEDDTDDNEFGITDGNSKISKKAQLPRVILCTGGSDAINVALIGNQVIWLNSETAKLPEHQYKKIMVCTTKLYQLPDIDLTGKRAAHELAMEYLEIFTIELPEALKEYRDKRGNPCKDVRDYFNHCYVKDFNLLVEIALPYRFWERKAKYEGRGENKTFVGFGYEFKNVQAYNFLMKNGFGRMPVGDKKTDWNFVHRTGNIVREVNADDVEDFLHQFLENRYFDIKLRDAMYQTSKLNEGSLARLKYVDVDFTDFTKTSQFIFFTNKTVEVTDKEILYHKPGRVERYIWEDELLTHHLIEPKQAPFKITKDTLGNYDIEIINKDCIFLKYLVQTSRVHWRKEIEKGEAWKAMKPLEQQAYLKEHHCDIAGPNLSEEEIDEQKQHLINKIFCIGFLLHRYKARNKGWFVWGMDNKVNDDGKSHGGSGKSIMFDMAMRSMLKKTFYVNGRNPKLTEDPHKYDGLTEHHRYILVDDAHEYLKIDAFYTDVTGDMTVNPKGKKPFSIPFNRSAKYAFTTNYTPRNLGPSTERRMIYASFSDWYHNKGETDDYLEFRDPATDLGLEMFTDFTREQWNDHYLTMLHCLQFYLGTDEKIRPAMENINKRNLMGAMGNFLDWAIVYLSEENNKLDVMFIREEAHTDYIKFNGSKITPQLFLEKLKAFCRYFGYMLNPAEYQDKDKKIIKKVEKKIYIAATNTWDVIENSAKVTKEMFYIQTRNTLPADPMTGFSEQELRDLEKGIRSAEGEPVNSDTPPETLFNQYHNDEDSPF